MLAVPGPSTMTPLFKAGIMKCKTTATRPEHAHQENNVDIIPRYMIIIIMHVYIQ